jgi:hypothetical protein
MASKEIYMRKVYYLIFSLAFLTSGIAFGQGGNLQFNQALTYQGELNGTTLLSPVYTVPEGKVWKIEFLTATRLNITNNVAFLGPLINGSYQVIGEGSFPIWLKAGDFIQYKGGLYANNGSDDPAYKALRSYFISILEFNIVQ